MSLNHFKLGVFGMLLRKCMSGHTTGKESVDRVREVSETPDTNGFIGLIV